MNLVFLAQRIRHFRKERGLTLEELAGRAQLTQSVLSKIENFRVTPSLAALARIAGALEVTLAELVDGIDERPRLVVVPKAGRTVVKRDRPKSRIVYRALVPTRHAKLMNPFVLEVPRGEPRREALRHEGEEFILVLKGCVELEYGSERHRLREGDSAYLDGGEKHRLVNPGEETAEVLCVFAGETQANTRNRA